MPSREQAIANPTSTPRFCGCTGAIVYREPDLEGAKYWIGQVYEGLSRTILEVTGFIATKNQSEFKVLYADAESDEAFIDRVYNNVLGRDPDIRGRTHWLSELNGDLSRANAIRFIALSPEFMAKFPYGDAPQ